MRGTIGILLALAIAGCASGETPGGNKQPVATGRQATSLVPGAIQARSAKYKLVGTTTVGNGWTSTPRFTKHGGIVGATQP
jgi:hypothetical protein